MKAVIIFLLFALISTMVQPSDAGKQGEPSHNILSY